MKRLWLILPLLFVFSCEDKKEPDTTPPNISFTRNVGFVKWFSPTKGYGFISSLNDNVISTCIGE